jgi:hypothetical protein
MHPIQKQVIKAIVIIKHAINMNILQRYFPESISGKKENTEREQEKQREELNACDVGLRIRSHFQLI